MSAIIIEIGEFHVTLAIWNYKNKNIKKEIIKYLKEKEYLTENNEMKIVFKIKEKWGKESWYVDGIVNEKHKFSTIHREIYDFLENKKFTSDIYRPPHINLNGNLDSIKKYYNENNEILISNFQLEF
jgi:hypothetical protein